MIRYIEGRIIEKGPNYITLLTNNGLGYQVYSTVDNCMKIKDGEAVHLYTHHSVREDNESLYGFSDIIELNMFELLISVSGLGPKGGLTLLSTNNINILVNAIKNKKPELLNKAPGVGKKTIEKIILELQDKVSNFESTEISNGQNELRQALASLGYNNKDIDQAVKNIDDDLLEGDDLNLLLREAFKYL